MCWFVCDPIHGRICLRLCELVLAVEFADLVRIGSDRMIIRMMMIINQRGW